MRKRRRRRRKKKYNKLSKSVKSKKKRRRSKSPKKGLRKKKLSKKRAKKRSKSIGDVSEPLKNLESSPESIKRVRSKSVKKRRKSRKSTKPKARTEYLEDSILPLTENSQLYASPARRSVEKRKFRRSKLRLKNPFVSKVKPIPDYGNVKTPTATAYKFDDKKLQHYNKRNKLPRMLEKSVERLSKPAKKPHQFDLS